MTSFISYWLIQTGTSKLMALLLRNMFAIFFCNFLIYIFFSYDHVSDPYFFLRKLVSA